VSHAGLPEKVGWRVYAGLTVTPTQMSGG
jgi:hypothetical protein